MVFSGSKVPEKSSGKFLEGIAIYGTVCGRVQEKEREKNL
jgi:hypothetical protein